MELKIHDIILPMNQPEASGVQKPYTFEKAPVGGYGIHFSRAVMKEGIIAGDRVGIRYVDGMNDLFIVEFNPFYGQHNNEEPKSVFKEQMRLSRSYHYHEDGINILFRGIVAKRTFRLQVRTNLHISRVRDMETFREASF